MIHFYTRWAFLVTVFIFHHHLSFGQCSQPVWSDEFDETTLNTSKWAFQTGNGCPNLCGWGNGELETYTYNSKNVYLKNGVLFMEAIKETVNGSSFTSAKLISLGKYSRTYGRFEARMRMPLGNGLWPAFWMLADNNNWPMTGEIDIMEYRGDKPKQTNATLHYGSPWPQNQYDGSSHTQSLDLSNDFHVYSVEWEENEMRFYFDKILIKKETKSPNSLNPVSSGNAWPWNANFYIILNLAVGGGFAGNPSVAQVQLTKPTFEIDYVRVYALPCLTNGIENKEVPLEEEVMVFPQPVNDFVQILVPGSVETFVVKVKDLNGRLVAEYETDGPGKIDISPLSKGMYIFDISLDEKQILKKVVKQ